jgi:hypothetical protein
VPRSLRSLQGAGAWIDHAAVFSAVVRVVRGNAALALALTNNDWLHSLNI